MIPCKNYFALPTCNCCFRCRSAYNLASTFSSVNGFFVFFFDFEWRWPWWWCFLDLPYLWWCLFKSAEVFLALCKHSFNLHESLSYWTPATCGFHRGKNLYIPLSFYIVLIWFLEIRAIIVLIVVLRLVVKIGTVFFIKILVQITVRITARVLFDRSVVVAPTSSVVLFAMVVMAAMPSR